MRRCFPVLLVLFWLFVSGPAQATTVVSVDLDTLTRTSDLIFFGTVTKVSSRNLSKTAKPQIVTEVSFRIERTLKGKPAGETFTFQMIGGTWKQYTLSIPGTPGFKKGERVVLFLEDTGKRFAVCGMKQGKFSVKPDEDGKLWALRDLSGMGLVRTLPNGKTVIEEGSHVKPILLDQLFKQIEQALAR